MQLIEINRTDELRLEQVYDLMCEAFGTFEPSLFRHIVRDSSPATTLYGVTDGSDLVAANCFLAHSVERGGVTAVAYQSCMSGTRKSHLGRGLFSRLIEHAKVDLKARGGAFIFGFPNSNSEPIFIKKLGFSVSPVWPVYFSRFTPDCPEPGLPCREIACRSVPRELAAVSGKLPGHHRGQSGCSLHYS